MPDADPTRTERPANGAANDADLALLVDAVSAAGALAVEHFNAGREGWLKDDRTPVSEADLAVDAFLKDRLFAMRPDYGWISEESPAIAAGSTDRATRAFIVDPIDGTRAFLNARDTWTVCVGVLEDGVPVAGVVFNPVRQELYASVLGGGAWLNGRHIAVSQTRALEGATLAGGEGVYKAAAAIGALHPPVIFTGATSMAYRLCLVAEGACDATVALSRKSPWDLAPGMLILHEAGGRSGDRKGGALDLWDGPVIPTVVGANPQLFDPLIAILKTG
ncbi:MAG: 3'(2'),5'-bisphosphate nucleotidase CysQ [Pseudomonadota bacterium]